MVMDVQFAKTFNDHVALMAANSPHALVMDWWRRLDLTLKDYAVALDQVFTRNRRAIEETVSLDLGLGFAVRIRGLRVRRNQVAHESIYLSSEDAAAYASEAFSLIASLARRVPQLESKR